MTTTTPRPPEGDWLGTPYLRFTREGPFGVCTLDRPEAGTVTVGGEDVFRLAEDRLRLIESNPQGRFQLFRVGDAVLSRNVHAAIYESARIMKNI